MYAFARLFRLLILAALILGAGCSSGGTADGGAAAATGTPTGDSAICAPPSWAKLFSIDCSGQVPILQTPYGSYQLETESESESGSSQNQTSRNVKTLHLPLRNMAIMSSTVIHHLEMLDAAEAIRGFDRPEHIFSPALQERVQSGEISAIGQGDGTVNLELLLSLNADAFISAGINDLDNTNQILQKAGIDSISYADWQESHPLGRAEWIIVSGILLGKAAEARQIFAEIEENYQMLQNTVRDYFEDETNSAYRPRVLINAPYGGSWGIPGGNSYAARFIQDAGGELAIQASEADGSDFLALEDVYRQAADADVWINPGRWENLTALQRDEPRLGRFRPVVEKTVYNYTGRTTEQGGMDYFESGTVRPDLVLKDLIFIFHPQLLPEHTLFYYKRID